MFWTGRRTCASASALSLEAQPAHLDKLVNRIFFPDGLTSFILFILVISREFKTHGFFYTLI